MEYQGQRKLGTEVQIRRTVKNHCQSYLLQVHFHEILLTLTFLVLQESQALRKRFPL